MNSTQIQIRECSTRSHIIIRQYEILMNDELGRTLEGPENHTVHNMVVRATIRKWLMCVECGIAKRATGRNQTHEVTDWDRKVLIPNYGGLFKTHD